MSSTPNRKPHTGEKAFTVIDSNLYDILPTSASAKPEIDFSTLGEIRTAHHSNQNEVRQGWLDPDKAINLIESNLNLQNPIVLHAIHELLTSKEDQELILSNFKQFIIHNFLRHYIEKLSSKIIGLNPEELSEYGLKIVKSEYRFIQNHNTLRLRLGVYALRIIVHRDFYYNSVENWDLSKVKIEKNRVIYSMFKDWYSTKV